MKKNDFKALTVFLMLVSVLCLVLTVLDVLNIIVVAENLKGGEPNFILWKIILLSIGALENILIGTAIFLIFNNVRRKIVFHKKNAQILRIFGTFILYIAVISMFLNNRFLPVYEYEITRFGLLSVIGGCLYFFSYVFKIGIKMQEEQELTI